MLIPPSYLPLTVTLPLNDFFRAVDVALINKLAFLTLILTMLLDTGLSLTVQQIWEPLRNIRLVILSLYR